MSKLILSIIPSTRFSYAEDLSAAAEGLPVYLQDDVCYLDAELTKDCGQIKSVTDETGNFLTADSESELAEIIARGYTAIKTGMDGKKVIIEVIPEERKVKAESGPIKMADKVAMAVKRVVDEGILTQEECDERIAYLRNPEMVRIPCIDEILVLLFNSMRKYDNGSYSNPKCLFVDTYTNEPLYKHVSIVVSCLIKALNRQATIYQGDKSVGKNVMAETIAWLLAVPVGKTTFNEKMTPDDLTGARTTAPAPITKFSAEEGIKANILDYKVMQGVVLNDEELDLWARYKYAVAASQSPTISVERTPIVEAVRDGGVFIADEANHGTANLLGSINGLLDGSKTFETASLGKININKDFVFIGTQNAGSNYTATNKLDAATLSRVGVVVFPYNDSIKNILLNAVKAETKERLTDKYFVACDKFYKGVKKYFADGVISDAAMNIRGMVNALNEVASVNVGDKTFKPLIKLEHAIKTCVVDACPDADNVAFIDLVNSCFAGL